jgi:membrane protein DedA with SNARE-associated domain
MRALLLIMAGSLASEDAALAASAALWASGSLGFETAFWGSFLGIGLGDMGLYGLGRGFGPWMARWIPQGRLDQGQRLFKEKGASFVLLSRFVPGARLTGYTAAGILRAPFAPFAAAVWASTLLWVGLWFSICGPLQGRLGWPAMLALLLLAMLTVHWLAGGFKKYEWRLRLIGLSRLRWHEFWPAWLFYFPVSLNYLWLSLRFGNPLLPSLSNPGIDNGGLINESKEKIFGLIPAGHPAQLKYQVWEPGSRPSSGTWPLIAKPDAGQRGSGVRLLQSQAELDAYAEAAGYRFITQEYCGLPCEAGVFYLRRPSESQGRIFSITKKSFPSVIGDGKRSLAELILADGRNRNMARVFFKRHAARLDEILAEGQSLRLVESGNHSQGCVFLNGAALQGRGLAAAIDALAKSMPGFFIGRFDLRYDNDLDFSQGRGFKIIEVNGASSEATHVYDPATPLTRAYATLFEQWRLVFEIGAANRALGLKATSPREFLAGLRQYRKSSRLHPLAS